MKGRDLKAEAEFVAAKYGAQAAAVIEAQIAEVEILRRVLEYVNPACPALASRVQIAGGGHQNDRWAIWRGVCLNEEKPGPLVPTGTLGYRGRDLFLGEDGRARELVYRDTEDGWVADEQWVDTEVIVRFYDAAVLIERLAAALWQQVQANRPTVSLLERAARLKALATLL